MALTTVKLIPDGIDEIHSMNEQTIRTKPIESSSAREGVVTHFSMRRGSNRKSLLSAQKTILRVSLPLGTLLITCSIIGLLYPEIYHSGTPNWITQTIVQDGVNLFLVTPVFIVATLYSYEGVKFAFLMWGGTIGYLVYTFLIYSFSVHFNALFLPYCIILGLSTYSLAWFVTMQLRTPVIANLDAPTLQKVTGIYFVTVSSVFYVLWLMDIIPAALSNQAPRSLVEVGLITNPVQVIDLSMLLPLVFVAGIMSIQRRPFTAILIPVILVFFVLMNVTIAALTIVLMQNGHGGSVALAGAMGVLALFSLLLLILFVVRTRDELGN